MTPEQILKIPARVLTQQQREEYFTNGYILLEKFIGDEWLAKFVMLPMNLWSEVKKSLSRTQSLILSPTIHRLSHV